MRRLLVIAAIVAITASLLALPTFNSSAQSATIVSVIVNCATTPAQSMPPKQNSKAPQFRLTNCERIAISCA